MIRQVALLGFALLQSAVGCVSDRIEKRETKEPDDEAADVRLPGYRLLDTRQRHVAKTEEDVAAEPYGDEQKQLRISQHRTERRGRDTIGFLLVVTDARKRPSPLERNAHGRRHGAGDCRR